MDEQDIFSRAAKLGEDGPQYFSVDCVEGFCQTNEDW